MSDKLVNLEDKIIAYLDGTLDETSRAELLHTLSVSPEKRKLLEEHIKLREIISLGHKPASVPLMTERKLADRIPILMQELPYLAEKSTRIAPIIPVSSTSYFTLLGRQVSSFFTSRVGQAVSLGTLALIGGMSWYMAQSNGDAQIGASAPVTVQHESASPAPSASSNSTQSNSLNANTGASVSGSEGGPAQSDVRSTGSRNLSGVASSSSNGRTNIGKSPVNNGIKTKDLQPSNIIDDRKNGDELASSSASNANDAVDKKSVDNTVDPSRKANNGSSSDETKKITDTQSSDANKSIKDPSELPPLPLPSAKRDVTGRMYGQVDYSSSFSVRPNVKAQEY
ncbi:MAG TPA: hypothetical protein VFH43_01725, partial [Candidatus Kapabacteria bacterium]|nr:hypothetical protein [Candidatus Kapabacteria bacterium]